MSAKKWKYNISAKMTIEGKEHSFITQLYKVGVYIIFDNNSGSQGNMRPSQMQRMCNRIKKDFNNNLITNLELGREITVTEDENGFYKELL